MKDNIKTTIKITDTEQITVIVEAFMSTPKTMDP